MNHRALHNLTPEEQAEVDELLSTDPVKWRPFPGPQTLALETKADIIGYGGAAGGGKTDLICGLAITQHERVLIMRREKAQTEGIVQRLGQILGGFSGYTSQHSRWVLDKNRTLIEFGGLDNLGDETRWQGRPHDAIFLDEATEMREVQVRFLLGWNRTNNPKQRKRVVLTFNPPTTVEGRWVIPFFAPWLDKHHPNPAVPGELRWFTTIDGKDREVPDNRRFVLVDNKLVYDFDPKDYSPEKIIKPESRTFIPARVTDNPVYMETDYVSKLQGMPEPLRSLMLYGDFSAGLKDDPYQVIPTDWVEQAMKRWKKPDKIPVMDSMGVDVALAGVMGQGRDEHVIMTRHGMWFAEPIAHEAQAVPDGSVSGGLVVSAWRNEAVIHVDLFGVGALTYGFLTGMQLQVLGINFGDKVPNALDQTGKLRFANLRSYLWWKMREMLDPVNNTGIALPPHPRLRADLCTPKWSLPGQVVKVESREEIMKKLGRSPDYATAAILALIDTPKRSNLVALLKAGAKHPEGHGHDPFMIFEDRTP